MNESSTPRYADRARFLGSLGHFDHNGHPIDTIPAPATPAGDNGESTAVGATTSADRREAVGAEGIPNGR